MTAFSVVMQSINIFVNVMVPLASFVWSDKRPLRNKLPGWISTPTYPWVSVWLKVSGFVPNLPPPLLVLVFFFFPKVKFCLHVFVFVTTVNTLTQAEFWLQPPRHSGRLCGLHQDKSLTHSRPLVPGQPYCSLTPIYRLYHQQTAGRTGACYHREGDIWTNINYCTGLSVI